MIRKECFTKEWIEEVGARFQYSDVNLIEKVIRAFSLVEMLSESGCPYVWKGGSSLMLLLGSGLHRLSVDVDIICPPGTDIEKFLTKFLEYGFTGRETIEREQRGTDVPKSHQKLHYRVAYLSRADRTESILLDVLYEDVQYEKVETLKVESPFIKLEGEPLTVRVPSVNDMLGDKLTAFAPNTSGIPYYKNGAPKFVEIIKQLYDVGRLFDSMTQDTSRFPVREGSLSQAKLWTGFRPAGWGRQAGLHLRQDCPHPRAGLPNLLLRKRRQPELHPHAGDEGYK